MRLLSPTVLKEVETVQEPDRSHYLAMRQYPPFPDFPIDYTLETPPDSLEFDSRFESGNLWKVVKVGERDYDLYLQFDTETKGHTQWYYFSVTNSQCGTFRFNIVNLMKFDSLYNEGLLPAVRSSKQGGDWQRGGFNVSYFQNGRRHDSSRYTYTLTFQYTFNTMHDTVYFAHSVPYTFTELCKYLEDIQRKYRDVVRVNPMCKTMAGNVCEMVTITENIETYKGFEEEMQEWNMSAAARKLNKQRVMRQEKLAESVGKRVENEHRRKQGIVLTARTHPGETPGSYLMKGVIDFLLSPCREAQILRHHYVFKLIPMVNPDGVRYGNYRCSTLGVDLNRRWGAPSKLLHPTIYHIKRMIQVFSESHNIVLFCDFHGHSCKRGVFAYGCARKTSELEDRKKSILARMIPLLLSQRNSCFSFKDCHFRINKSKESTARVVAFKEFGIVNSYTLEASFYGPKKPSDFRSVRSDCHMQSSDYEDMGKDVCRVCIYFTTKSIFARKLRAVSEWFRGKSEENKGKNAGNFLRSRSMQDSLIQKTPVLKHYGEFAVQETGPHTSVAKQTPDLPLLLVSEMSEDEEIMSNLEGLEGSEEEGVMTVLDSEEIWTERLDRETALESDGEEDESDSAPSDHGDTLQITRTTVKPRKKRVKRRFRSTKKPYRREVSEDMEDNKTPQRLSQQGLKPVPPLPRPVRQVKSPTGYPNSSIVTFSFLEDSSRVSTSETSREAGLRRPGRLAELLRPQEVSDEFPLQVNGQSQGRRIGISNYSYMALQRQLEKQEDRRSRVVSAQPGRRKVKPQPPQEDSMRRIPKPRPPFRRKPSDVCIDRSTPKDSDLSRASKGRYKAVFL